MNLDTIQEQWRVDSQINSDLYSEESVKIASHHAKYYEYINVFSGMKIETEGKLNTLVRDKWKYYKGKAPATAYREVPFDLKLTNRDEVETFINADPEVIKNRSKLAYIETCMNYLDSIIRMINNRGFHIKNAIDWEKFQAGM